MFAEIEDNQPKGRYVTYQCPACKHREKVFESYAG
jgi:ribosomal protein S27E